MSRNAKRSGWRPLESGGADEELAGRHYAEHKDKPFYGELVETITSGPVMALAFQGPPGAAAIVRTLMGATNASDAAPGTIRGDFAIGMVNVVHGSDSPESGASGGWRSP